MALQISPTTPVFVQPVGPTAGTNVTQASLGALLYPQTPAELTAGVTPSNYAYASGDVRRYGATLDGATDCVAAMVSACKVGGNVSVPGAMALASASLAALANSGIAIASNARISGIPGMPCTVTGVVACDVFYTTDVSNVEFIDFFCIGNGVGTGTLGYFWYSKHTAAATQEALNHRFIRGGLQNFTGYYWMYWDNTAATTYAIRGIVVDGARFVSKTGNNQGQSSVTITATVCGFSGSDTVNGFYTIKDAVVRNCTADGTYIKNFVYFWSGCLRCKAHDNILSGFGSDAGTLDDMGSYALAAYDHSHGTGLQPTEVEFYSNTIDVVRDCGIYAASANVITLDNNRIQGQTSVANSVIPKGAIAINACTIVNASDNVINSSAIGVSVVQGPNANAYAVINRTSILQAPANAIGMLISGSTGGNANDISVNGFKCDTAAATVAGIQVNATATVGINNLDLNGIDIHGAAIGIRFFAPDSSVPALGNVRINGVKLRRITGNNIQFPSNSTNATQRVEIENVVCADMQAGAVGLLLASVINLTVRGVTFKDMTAGATFCWYGGAATGRVSNVQYVNVAINNRYSGAANELGVVTPVVAGNDNDLIQDLNPNELGAAASKYTRQGWTWDRVAAAWKEVRALTGN